MAATKRHVNVSSVGFTPTSGSLLTITGVTSIAIDNGGSLIAFSGDGDHYNTTVVNDFADPTFSITSADINALNQLVPGTRGVFTCTLNDAKNKATTSGGALIYTAANAIVGDNSHNGSHRQFSSGTLMIKTESSDGQTSPVTVAAA